MEKFAFRMQLKPHVLEVYKRYHAEIWPELVTLLREAGIHDYSIHHDAQTDALFATLWRYRDHRMDTLPEADIMRRWWIMMEPLMEINADGSPVSVALETVFHLR